MEERIETKTGIAVAHSTSNHDGMFYLAVFVHTDLTEKLAAALESGIIEGVMDFLKEAGK